MPTTQIVIQYISQTGKILLYSSPLLFATWLVFLYYKWKPYPIEAIIIEKRDKNLIKTNDRLGRYEDKFSGMTGYKFLKCKDKIPIADLDWILHNVNVPTNMFERFVNFLRATSGTIILFKYGSKQYKPIRIGEGTNAKIELIESKDKKGNQIFYYTYLPLDPRDKLRNIDFEVVDWDNMNFMTQEIRASIDRRKRQKDWMYTIGIPAMMIAGAALAALIMIKFGYDYGIDLSSPPNQVQTNGQTTQQDVSDAIPVIGSLIPGG